MRGAEQKEIFEISDLSKREILHLRSICSLFPRGGGGGGGDFLWFKILNLNILGIFRKLNIFGDIKILWIFFGSHYKIGLYMY